MAAEGGVNVTKTPGPERATVMEHDLTVQVCWLLMLAASVLESGWQDR
jgi:hypothetical protein